MHVLIAAVGTSGDVLPFIAIGAELRRRGHWVSVATAQTFEPMVLRAGLLFESLTTAEEHRRLFGGPHLWRPVRGFRSLFEAVEQALRPTYDFAVRNHRRGRTILVASTLALGARVAADAGKGPLVTVHLAPIMMQSRHEAPRTPGFVVPNWLPSWLKWELQLGVDKYFIDPQFTAKLNAFRAGQGLAPIRRLRHWWHSRRRVLLMFPAWFAAPQPDWPAQARQIGFPRADAFGAEAARLDERLEAFLAAGPAPVAVTFGSTAAVHERAVLTTSIEACMRLGLRCIVLTRLSDVAPPGLEGRVFVAPYAAFGALLPRAAALVHHGGVGSLAQAFAAGAPQLIVPTAFDHFDNAARVARLGCGVWMRRRGYTVGRAARALKALLASPAVAARCAEIAAACAGDDAVGRACDEIEAAFAPRRPKQARKGLTPASGR